MKTQDLINFIQNTKKINDLTSEISNLEHDIMKLEADIKREEINHTDLLNKLFSAKEKLNTKSYELEELKQLNLILNNSIYNFLESVEMLGKGLIININSDLKYRIYFDDNLKKIQFTQSA